MKKLIQKWLGIVSQERIEALEQKAYGSPRDADLARLKGEGTD